MTDKQNVFNLMESHLLKDEKPSGFFENSGEAFYAVFPLTMLGRLRTTGQSARYHPEGSVWNHTMLVIDKAAELKEKSSSGRCFMWAALLHDIGKPLTTSVRGGRITSYDHEKAGAALARDFLREFTPDAAFIEKVCALVRWHMQILFVVKSMSFADIKGMKSQCDVNDIALLGYCDRMGRAGADKKHEEENLRIFLLKCKD